MVVTTVSSDTLNVFLLHVILLRVVGKLKHELYISPHLSSSSLSFRKKNLFQFPATSSTRQFLAIMRAQPFTHRSFNSPCIILCSHHLTHMHIVRARIHEHTHGNVLSHLHFIKCLCAYLWTVTPRFCFSCLLSWFFFSLPVAHCGFWLRVICKWHWLNVKSGGQEGSANWNRCFSARRQFGGWLTVRSALTREGRPEKSCDADCNQYFCICLHFVKPDYGKRRKTAGVVGAGGVSAHDVSPGAVQKSFIIPSSFPLSFPPPPLLQK